MDGVEETGALPSAHEGEGDNSWFGPSVRGIGAASLLSDLGHEVPTALLPSFLTSTLGAPAAALGVIEGVADGLAGVARLGGGALADDPDRRRATAVGGYTATAVLSGLIGVATSAWQVGVLQARAWTARGLRVPARNALLADAVPREAYGRAYGFERAMENLGAIGGPLLALALVAAFSVRTAILLSIIPGLLAAFAIVYAIRRLPRLTRHRRRGGAPAAAGEGAARDAGPLDPLIYRFHEITQVYGTTIKELIHEEFGDGIMSAVDFEIRIERRADPKGDRVVVTPEGKFLPYRVW